MQVKPGYKQTQVGVIPEDWRVETVGQIGVLGRGRVISHREISASINKAYPVYSSQTTNDGVMGFIDTFEFEGEYITWTTDGANAGTVFYRNRRFNCTNVCGTIKLRRDNTFYVSKALSGVAPRYVSRNLGNPKLMNNVMKRIPVALPPTIPEQHAIATALADIDTFLGALDKLIAKKRDLKQAAMQQLLTGQTRLPGFSGEWEEKPLSEIASATKGTQLRSSKPSENGLFAHLNGGITPSGYAEKANTPGSTIAISEGGNSCGYVQFMAEPYWCGGHCYSVVPIGIDNCFLYHALKARQTSIMALRVGSGLPNVQKTALLAFKLTFPTSAAEQTAIAMILSDLDAEIVALETKLAKARQIKQGMMQELLTGKTRLI